MEFFVSAPEEPKPAPKKKGGTQTARPLNLKIISLPSGQLMQEVTMQSAHEAAKYCEMYSSRSNIASNLKRHGWYAYQKKNKLFVFTAAPL